MDKINSKETYQWIYDNVKDYGNAKKNHCPGIRSWPFYKDFLYKTPLMDLGSGTGQTVEYFRKHGFEAYGIDYIEPNNEYCKQGDITKSMDLRKYRIITCFDVIEHLDNAQVKGLFQNMVHAEQMIFTIANTPSIVEIEDEKYDLHINKKAFSTWRGIIRDYFDIYHEIELRDYQHLYLCKRKESDQGLISELEKRGYIVYREDQVWS